MQQQLRGLVLLRAELPRAWERVCRLAFGPRLDGAPSHHIYLEVQGRRAVGFFRPFECVRPRLTPSS